MKHTLLVIAATLMFLNAFVVPRVAHADGVGSTSCNGQTVCKP